MKKIAMLSGGQDSTAMTLRLLEIGEQVDYIVFCDTGLEHDEMYEYIDKLDKFFQRKYSKSITRLYPKYDFEHWAFGLNTKGESVGLTRGTPKVLEACYWRRESKEYPFNRWVKENKIKEYVIYVGYVYGEFSRYDSAPDHTVAPLIDWMWREDEVQKYLKENEMENSLYQSFRRTGCAICPKQSEASKYIVYKKFPEKWKYMKDMEHKLNSIGDTRKIPRWHIDLFIEDLEEKFKKKDRQLTIDLDFAPLSDCFCKI